MKLFVMSNFLSRLDLLDRLLHSIKRSNPDIIVFTGNILTPGIKKMEWETSQKNAKRARRNNADIVNEITVNKNIAYQFFNTLSLANIPTLFVPGENDSPLEDVNNELSKFSSSIQNIHKSKSERNDLLFLGYGGAIKAEDTSSLPEEFFKICYTYDMLKFKLRRFKFSILPKILVFHSSPNLPIFNIPNVNHSICDKLNSIFKYISPDILLSSGVGNPSIDFIKDCWVINPGSVHNEDACIFNIATHDFRAIKI